MGHTQISPELEASNFKIESMGLFSHIKSQSRIQPFKSDEEVHNYTGSRLLTVKAKSTFEKSGRGSPEPTITHSRLLEPSHYAQAHNALALQLQTSNPRLAAGVSASNSNLPSDAKSRSPPLKYFAQRHLLSIQSTLQIASELLLFQSAGQQIKTWFNCCLVLEGCVDQATKLFGSSEPHQGTYCGHSLPGCHGSPTDLGQKVR